MQIIKRDGRKEPVKLEKISKRIGNVCKDLKSVDVMEVAQKVIAGLYDGVSSRELDELAIQTAAALATKNPEYDSLAARLSISCLHKDTPSSFWECVQKLYGNTDLHGTRKPLISEKFFAIVKKHHKVIDSQINHKNDFKYDYFGFKTLERAYLLRSENKIIERPQYMLMRVAIGIHGDNLEDAFNTYEGMSELIFTHATPTLFNAGTLKPQLSSCFLINTKDDSIDGIYSTLKDIAKISQSAGGIGVHIHNIRSKGSPIHGTGGTSNGIIPMLKVFESTAKYVDQGGNKRKGSAAVYLEPWHGDIMEFLDLRKNTGKEEIRCRDLNTAMWVPDLFMERVRDDKSWSLFCPNKAKGLSDCYGKEFNALYEKYEGMGIAESVIPARDVWQKILEAQIEGGEPYILYKDAGNRKTNQKNIGVIKSSNLCLSGDNNVRVKKTLDSNTAFVFSIDEMWEFFSAGNDEWYIESYDENTSKKIFAKIKDIAITGRDAECLKITDKAGNSLICTYNHRIFTKNRGYVEAQNLIESDDLMLSN